MQARKGRASYLGAAASGTILRELGSGPRPLGVTELSERLGLAKATVNGLLRSLESEELVERDAETGKYRLGRPCSSSATPTWTATSSAPDR